MPFFAQTLDNVDPLFAQVIDNTTFLYLHYIQVNNQDPANLVYQNPKYDVYYYLFISGSQFCPPDVLFGMIEACP